MKQAGGNSNEQANAGTALVPVRPSRAPASSQRAGAHHLDVVSDRQWLTAAEAAAEALPGLPSSKRQMNRLLNEAGIKCRTRNARGGGREFHYSDLPREARAEYLKRYGVAETATLATLTPAARETEKDLRAETRKKIVDAATVYVTRSKRTKGKALEAFGELYAAQRLRGFEAVDYQLEPTATPDQVRTWERTVRIKGAGALIDGRGRPTGTGFFDKAENVKARNYVIAAVAANGRITARDLCGDLERDEQVSVALRTMQSFVASIRSANPGLLKALHNPDQFRSHHKPAFGSRSANLTTINELWELDATRADAMCRMPDGSERRVNITGVIDVFTRRAMLLVSDQPRALATQALLRRAVMAWGLPKVLKTDNGKEFANRDVVLFCDAAGIQISYSRPFHPEEKPHVERFFGTLNHSFFPGLQGYVGANVAERKAIESRNSFSHRFGDEARLVFGAAITPAGLQARLDAWCRDDYEQRPHEGLKGKGETPAQVALLHAHQVKHLADERALDKLLMPLAGMRVVLKRGISVASRFFIADELGGIMGQRVMVRHDPHDPSRIFVYNRTNSAFLCIAVDPELLTGDERMRIAIGAQRIQRQVVNETRETVRGVHRLYPPGSAADRRLQALQGDGFMLQPDAAEGMVAAASPRLSAASDAAKADDAHGQPDQPVAATDEQRATATAMIADMTEQLPQPARLVQCDGYERPFFENDMDFWRWAQTAPHPLDADDSEWLSGLKASPTFQLQLRTRGQA